MATNSDTTTNVTAVSAVLLVDNRVQNYLTIVASLRDDVRAIVYDVTNMNYLTIIDFVKVKIAELNIASFSSIGIVEYNEHKDYYHFFGQQSQPSLISGIITTEPNLSSWSHVADFITYLKTTYSIQNFDMLACALYVSNDWKYIIDTLTTSTGVQVRASTDKTGSTMFGGDWTLESTGTDIDLKTVYFNENIENFEGVLDVAGIITNTVPEPFYPSYSTEAGYFLWPTFCRIYNNRIYVADGENSDTFRIQLFDFSLNYISNIIFYPGTSVRDGIVDFAINPTNGRIHLVSNHHASVYDASGGYLFQFSGFIYPRAIALDLSGNIYISAIYSGVHAIKKYDSAGVLLGTFIGTIGTGDGQIGNATAMIFDSSNNMWVSDQGASGATTNHRIQKFDISGNFLLKFGSGGTGNTNFRTPMGQAFDSEGNIYVADFENDLVKKFTNTGTFLMSFGTNTTPSDWDRPEVGKLDGPYGVAVDSSNNLYVMERNNFRLQKFNSAGVSLASRTYLNTNSGTANGYFNLPWGVAVHPPNGNVYVVDQGNNRVQKFDASLSFVWSVGSLGSGDSSFNQPRYVAIDASENIYVTDRNNHAVKVFNSSGVYQRRVGSGYGNSYGQLNNPGGISVDTSFNVYVSDNNSRVQMFDSTGVYVNQFYLGHNPQSIAMDSARNLYVTSSTNITNVYKYPTVNAAVDVSINTVLQTISSIGTIAQYMAVTSDENRLLMSNAGNGTITVFNLKTLTTITNINVGDGPTGIVINSANTLAYVTMWNGQTVKVIDLNTYSVVATISGVGYGPFNIAINPANTRVYAVGGEGVSVIDTTNNTLLTRISVGNNPRNISIDNTGTYALVSVCDEHKVKRMLLSDNSITHSITVGLYPRSVCFNSQNTLAFVNNGGTTTVSVIDLSTFTVTSTITVGLNPQSNAITNNFLYVSNETGDSISVVSLSNYSVSTFSIGDGPHSLVMGPSKRFVYVALYNENTLKILSAPQTASLTLTSQGSYITGISVDLSTNNFITVQTGNIPRFKMYDPSGTVIYSSNLSVNGGQGVFLYNNSSTLFYTDTYGHGLKKVTLINAPAPTYQSISQVTKTFGVDASFSLTAVMTGISNSSGAYTFTTASTAITISGGVATINAYTPSAITVTASQASTANYSAGSTTFTVLINRGPATYQSIAQVTKTFGVDVSFSLAAVMSGISNRSGAYTFSSNSAAVSVSGSVATINAYTPSAITITASQDASGNYAASSTTFTVLVNRGTATYQSIAQVTKTFGTDVSFSLAAVVAGKSNSTGAYTFSLVGSTLLSTNNMNNITSQIQTGGQYQTNLKVAYAGNISGWSKVGAYAAQILDISNVVGQSNTPNYVFMVWTDSIITQNTAVSNSNTSGIGYTVRFKAGPTVYQTSNEATQATVNDGIVFEVLRSNNTVLATSTYLPGAWTGVQRLTDSSFSYTGDGTGDIRLRIKPVSSTTGRFGGCVDDVIITSNSGSSVVGGSPTELSISGSVATINSFTTSPVVIMASQDASGDYAASSTTFTVLVNRATPTYQTIPQVTKTFGTDASFSLSAVMAGISNSSGAYTFSFTGLTILSTNNMNDISSGTFNGGQYQTNLKVAFSGNLIGWDEGGSGTVCLVDISNVVGASNTPNYVIMFWQDNSITQTTAVNNSNISGMVYTVSYRAGPAVYQIASQATTANATDGIVFEVLRANNTVLATSTYLPGAWTGTQTLTASSFNYTGDGTGNIRIRIKTVSTTNGRFGGCVDDVSITSGSAITPTQLTISGDVATINAFTPSAIMMTASQAESGSYSSGSTNFTVFVNRATPTYQTIPQVTKTFGVDASFSLTAVMSGISNSSGAYTFSSNSSAVSVSGGIATINAYTPSAITITASQDASGNYAASSTTFTVLVNRGTPTYQAISQVTKTFGVDVSFSLATVMVGISNSSGAYTFSTNSAAITIVGSVATINAYTPSAVTITASQDASGNYAASSTTFTVLVNRTTPTYQSITQVTKTFGVDASFSLSAVMAGISNSTGAYTFSSGNAAVSVSGDVAIINEYTPSAITMTASQDASGNYSASSTTFTVLVNRGTPTYQSIPQVTKMFGVDASFSLTAVMVGVSNSSGAYTFSSSSAEVSVSGGVAIINTYTPSAITITANQAASGNYSASSTTFTVLVNGKTPTYGSFSIPAATYGDASFSIAPYAPTTDSSAVPFTYTSSDPTVATISSNGTVITIIGQGYTTITASQVASGNFTAGSVTTSFLVNRAAPTFLRAFTIPNKTFGVDVSFALLPLTDGLDNTDGAYHFSSSNAEIVAISEDGLTANILGYTSTTPVTIYVAIDACGNYAAATTSGTVSIARGTPTYQSISQVTKTFGDAAFSLTDIMSGKSNSSGAYTFTSSDASAVSIGGVNGDTATILAYTPSAITITASQAASGNYSASSTTFTVLVNRKTPTYGTFTLGSLNGYYDVSDVSFPLTAPTSDSSAAFTYSSSNTSVAVIADTSYSTIGIVARYDPSHPDGLMLTSGNVSAMVNLEGSSGYNLFATSGNPPPVTVNSLTMVNSENHIGFSRTFPITSNLTICMVIRYNPSGSTVSDYTTLFRHGETSSDVSIFKMQNTGHMYVLSSNNNTTSPAITLDSNKSYVLVGRFTASTGLREFWAYSDNGTTTYASASGISILHRNATFYLGGTIASVKSYFGEVLYYNTSITDQALSDNVSYLRKKWFNAAITISKQVRLIGSGTATITASQDICGNYAASSTSSILRVGATVPTFGTFTVSATTKTYGDAPFTLTPPTTNSNGAFSFSSSDTSIISISGTTATILAGGTVTISVTQDPSGSFTRKTVSQSITIQKKSPNLSNFGPFTVSLADGSYNITPPTTDNPSPTFTYQRASGTSVIIDNMYVSNFRIVAGGASTITANISENSQYTSGSISTTVTVTPIAPTNSYSNFSREFSVGTFTIPAPTTNNIGAAITYTSSDTSVATISSNTATILKVGTTIITARIAASASYLQSDVSAVLTITKGTPTMTGGGLNSTTITMTTTPYIPTATSTSNGAFTYESSNPAVVSVTNNNTTINPVSLGSATISATISEDTSGNYNSRTTTFVITVIRATSNLSSATFIVPNAMTYGDTPVNITVAPTSNNSSVPIVYSSSNTSVATIDASSGVITAQGAGTVYFIATQALTDIYSGNSVNSSNMIVNRKTVTQTKNAPYTESTIAKNYGDAAFQLSTTSESTGGKTYNTNVGGIVSISNPSGIATVSIIGVGTVIITGIQFANSRYSTQNDAVWTLTVGKGTTALTGLAATLTKNVTDAPFYVSATSASSGTKTYALANPGDTTVLTVNSSTGLVTLKGAGTATVVISQAASALYNAPASVSCVITVNEAGTALQGATLSSDRVFTNVDMTGASLANSTITSVSFSGATLTNAVMSSSTVRNAVMTSATLTGASFASSDISGTDFTSATLSSANMANTVLRNSIMTNAVLTGAAMTNATITRTTFTGATVRSANLTGATLTDSTLTSADMSGSILRAANVAGSSFVNAVLANTDLSGAVVTNANFTNANIRGANITNVAFSPLQKLQLLKNTNNRDIGGVQVTDVSGSVVLSAISGSSPATTIPNISNSIVKVVIPPTTTVVGETIQNVTLDTSTSDKFYFPINTDEYFQVEGVKYYVSDGVIKRQSDNQVVSVVTYGNRRIWLIAGSVIASVLQLNTISSSTFTVESYKLDTDAPFSITTAPTSNSTAPIVYSSNNPSVATINSSTGVITIHKQGYVNFIATQAETELYEGGSKTSNELFVNKLINFTLTGLNQTILMNTLASLDASAVSLENTDAAAVFYVKQSDMKNVFKFQSDSNDMNDISSSDVKYYVFDRNWPTELKINPLHAMMNKSESANMLGNAETFDANKMLVKHDFIRYLSLCLFNTIHGVDLFKNEMDLLENAVYGGETNRNTIHTLLGNVSTTSSDETMSYDASGNKYLTNDASGNTNLCRELLRQMVAGAPSRFGIITDGTTAQSLPFEPDDTINFKLTLEAAPTQNVLTGVSVIPSRSYLIKLVIKSSVTGGTANTVVTDSEMYPNSYPYSSSVVSYAPTSASSAVYNSYSPPAPIPFSRFGFNGWYYTNSSAWVNVAPTVRNHVKWLVPANSAGSSTVGGLQYIRVNLKIHNKTALPYLMVYTQTGSYRKYAVSGGSGALTNGTKYTFYMNFNSYTREPAVVGYTNAVLVNTVGTGSFANNEIISSIAVETDSNATAGSVEFTLGGMIVGDIVSGVSGEKEYGFTADVPSAYP